MEVSDRPADFPSDGADRHAVVFEKFEGRLQLGRELLALADAFPLLRLKKESRLDVGEQDAIVPIIGPGAENFAGETADFLKIAPPGKTRGETGALVGSPFRYWLSS